MTQIKKKIVLVTGAGAVLGQGILRSLNQTNNKYLIHTADPDWKSAGHWLGNKAHIVPMANDAKYMEALEKLIAEEKIDAVLIGTDVELSPFARDKTKLLKKYGVKIVVSNEQAINIANDKWKTAEFLRNNNFPFAISALSSDINGIDLLKSKAEFPYIAKPIDGARSKGIIIVNTNADLAYVTSFNNNLVVQEFLPEDKGEFTSGCVVLDGKARAVVTLRRDLRDGNTYRAYYQKDYERFTPFISNVAEKLGIDGPCNFQFRIKNDKPVIFEINCRFSGTTPIRSFFGFNEVDAILDYVFMQKEIITPKLTEGMVMRVWADMFVNSSTSDSFHTNNYLSEPTCMYYPFKTMK